MAIPSSLGTFSTFAIHHEPSPDDSALDITPLPDVHLSGAKANSRYDFRSLPTYISDRARRPFARSRKGPPSRDDSEIQLKALDSDVATLSKRTSVDIKPTASIELTQSDTPLNSATLTRQQKRNGFIQFLAICWSFYLGGWHDGTTGPLLPRIQEHYNVGFTIVSLIFIAGCSGFLCGAALNVWLNEKLGFGKTMALGAICYVVSTIIVIPSPPFPLFVISYSIAGFGVALQGAQGNGFIASQQFDMSTKLGIVHAAYGFGAFSSPFSATYFSSFTDRRWAYHFIISGGLSIVNTANILWIFRLRQQDDILLEAGQERTEEATTRSEGSTYRQIARIKAVHFMAIFALIYTGVEVTLGGWIVTYIIRQRHGGHSAGYISSGFFGGLTLGRVCLMWLNKRVGEHRVIFIYSLIAIGLEFTIWFVPSIIENAIAISFVGLVLGPMFPLLIQHMTNILPSWLMTGSVGLVSGIGVAGSAALPFITGLLASKYGIGSLQPLMISMMGALVLVWALVPKTRRLD